MLLPVVNDTPLSCFCLFSWIRLLLTCPVSIISLLCSLHVIFLGYVLHLCSDFSCHFGIGDSQVVISHLITLLSSRSYLTDYLKLNMDKEELPFSFRVTYIHLLQQFRLIMTDTRKQRRLGNASHAIFAEYWL